MAEVLLAMGAAASALPQDAPTPLTAEQIVRQVTARNDQRMARLRAYSSTRVYEVDYKGFGGARHAKMTVVIHYQSFQKAFTVVSEQGSKLLLNRVVRKALESEQEATSDEMRRRSALNEENYSFQLLGHEMDAGRPMYVLRVLPKRKDKFLYDGKVWIDASDFAIARLEVQPAKNPSFWITSVIIEHRNAAFQGIWLPAANRSASKIRFGGNATLSIDYGKYDSITIE